MKPFHWFEGETVEELRAQLNAAGAGARLEVRQHGEDMTLHVVPAGVVPLEGSGGLNKSHICPPDCP
jgi:hypothetical protein